VNKVPPQCRIVNGATDCGGDMAGGRKFTEADNTTYLQLAIDCSGLDCEIHGWTLAITLALKAILGCQQNHVLMCPAIWTISTLPRASKTPNTADHLP